MMKNNAAMLPGSFDPVTVGHEDLIRRASAIFDVTYAVIFSNTEKDVRGSGMFTPGERLEMLEAVCEKISCETGRQVYARLSGGLAVDFAHENGVGFIVKGARTASDFDYETGLYGIMRRFDESLETVIIPSKAELACISSTYCRELIKYSSPIEGSIPDAAVPIVKRLSAEWFCG